MGEGGAAGGRERTIEHGALVLHADGILHLTLRQGLHLDGETMRQIFDAAWDFAPGRRPILVDGRGATGITSEAREVSKTGQAAEWTSGLAVVLHSLVAVAVADFMVLLARPPYPTRLFRAIDPARAWLASL